MAAGIGDLIRLVTQCYYATRYPEVKYFALTDLLVFAGVGRPKLPAEVDESEVEPGHPLRQWRCRACGTSIERFDPRHSRDPDTCRYPLIEPREYTCKGCQQRDGRTSGRHTWVPGECRLADPEVRGRTVERQGGVHEPRRPAATEPDAGLRDWSRHGDTDALQKELLPSTGGAESSDARRPGSGGRPLQFSRHVETQADEGPSWSDWDLGRAVRGLRSDSKVVVTRTLRKYT